MAAFTDIEKEVIVLDAAWGMINSMVNRIVMELHQNDPDSQIVFEDYVQQEYFSILLVDFLASPNNAVFDLKKPYIDLLNDVCEKPLFNIDSSIKNLKPPVSAFKDWLNTEIVIEGMWFPNINLEIDLKLTRDDFLYIGGNITKHNFTKLSIVVKMLDRVFKANGCDLSDADRLLATEDFYNWFHGDGNIFNYHSHSVAEFLNNIRWGIFHYLEPEYARSYTPEKHPGYSFKYPAGVQNELAQKYYWDLMNRVRGGVSFPKFTVTKWLKKRY